MVERDAQLEGGQPLLEAVLDVISDERLYRAPHPLPRYFPRRFACLYDILSLRVHSVITSIFCHYEYILSFPLFSAQSHDISRSLLLVSFRYLSTYAVLLFVYFFSRAFQSRCYTIYRHSSIRHLSPVAIAWIFV